jgi:hypothetical protein
MFSHTPSNSPTSELDKNLQSLKDLLAEKYLNVTVKNVSVTSDHQVKVMLLNGRHGVDEGIDAENERPIQYLETFDASVRKEKAQYSYWSYSVITFPESKLKDITDGLKAMATPKPENNQGKLLAYC